MHNVSGNKITHFASVLVVQGSSRNGWPCNLSLLLIDKEIIINTLLEYEAQ